MNGETYSSKNISIIINGIYMTGLRDGDMYSYTEDEDRVTPYKGADGQVAYSIKPTNEAQITIGFKHTSTSLRHINNWYDNNTRIDLTIIDNNEGAKQTINGANGLIMRRPDSSRGKTIGEEEVVIFLPDHTVVRT